MVEKEEERKRRCRRKRRRQAVFVDDEPEQGAAGAAVEARSRPSPLEVAPLCTRHPGAPFLQKWIAPAAPRPKPPSLPVAVARRSRGEKHYPPSVAI